MNIKQDFCFCSYKKHNLLIEEGARCNVVGCGIILQAGRSRVRFPMK
jgi:hypothetical protein